MWQMKNSIVVVCFGLCLVYWLRNRNTLEYVGIREKIYNPNFNYGEFAIIRNQAGLNRFKISVNDFEKVYVTLLLNPSNSRGLKKEAGLNVFTLSPKKWIDTTQGHNDSIHLLVFVRCHNVAYIYKRGK